MHHRFFRPARLALALFALCLVGPSAAAQPKPAAPPPERALAFEVGKETKIDDPAAYDKHHVLYVPKDYTPDREWPIIFCYHGMNQSAKVWPFKELTDGKGYVVVGMSYLTERGADLEQEYALMKRVAAQVGGTLKVNPKMIFVGGFSLGGVWTYRLSNKDPNLFAGVIALGMAGGAQGSPEAWRGKPVMIAHGETDEYTKNIESTVDSYKKLGAAVSHEVFKGQGHTVDTRNPVLKKWLLDNGPLSAVKADFEKAQTTEKSGKLGPAFAMYSALAKLEGGGAYGKSAGDAAKAISDAAEARLADAEQAVSAKKYPDAIKALVAVEKLYAGSALADKAKERLSQIQSDPAIKAEIEQARIDSAADAAEAQALSFEKSKDYARAIAVYERYVAQYDKAARHPQVKSRLESLKSDKTLQAGIAGKQAETDCKAWLNMADNYAKAGFNDKARPYLQKVLDQYPDTPYARTAREKLAVLR